MKSKQLSIESYSKKKEECHEWISELIGKDGISLNQLVSSRFIRMSFQIQNLDLPNSVNGVKNILLKESSLKIERIKETIANKMSLGFRYSVIFDEWTSRNNARYVGVILKSSDEIHRLGVIEIFEKATADNILELVKLKLDLVGLGLDKIVAFITDGASTMRCIHKKVPCEEVICILHGIHIAIKEALFKQNDLEDCDYYDDCSGQPNKKLIENLFTEELKETVKKFKKIVSMFHHSPLLSEKLENYAKEYNINSSKIPQIIEIRWNSFYLSLEKFLELKNCIFKVILDENEKRVNVIFIL